MFYFSTGDDQKQLARGSNFGHSVLGMSWVKSGEISGSNMLIYADLC